jgi:uncharacterized protein with PIN domain
VLAWQSVVVALLNHEPDADHIGRCLMGLRRVTGWTTVLEVSLWCSLVFAWPMRLQHRNLPLLIKGADFGKTDDICLAALAVLA